MRRVEFLMGMPISIDIPNAKDGKAFKSAFDLLEEIGKRFSPFRDDNELAAYQHGETTDENLSTDMKEIVAGCKQAEELTNGYFSARFEGKFNPTGYVKGWAIAKAGETIEKQGYKTYCVGAGGDILARSNGDKKWDIGIQDPGNKSKILDVLSISNGAVATSGTAERGRHIINPKTGKPAADFLSVTVSGPNIIMADVLATAAFVAGDNAPKLLAKHPDYKAYIVK